MQPQSSRTSARILKLVIVVAVIGLGTVAYANHIGFEKLDPPVLLTSGEPIKDRIHCGADRICVRGPYILDTGEEGRLPEDLSQLVVQLDSGDVDLDLIIVFQYVEEGGSWGTREEWVVCISDSYGGQESCKFSSERALKALRGKKIFIFIGNPSESGGHEFTLKAEWEPARPALCRAETCLPLVSNVPVTKTIEANGFRFIHEEKQARLATFTVPAGAQVLAVRVRAANPQANVDAFIGRGRLDPQSDPVTNANFALVSSFGEEMLILPRPPSGTYWLAVRNNTNEPQAVELIATVLMDLQELKPGTPTTGPIDAQGGLLPFLAQYLRSTQGMLAPTQYRLTLKDTELKGVTALQITLRGAGAPNLHLRFEKIVEIRDGLIIADLSAVGPMTEKTVSLSGVLLKPGAIYLAIEGVGALPQTYELQAQLIKPGAAANQVIIVPLEIVPVRVDGGS
jgi:hypothetical protein